MQNDVVLIDGYNVIRRTPTLAKSDRISLEHGRQALLMMLAARYRPQAQRIIVVFDGAGQHETRETYLGMQIVYSADSSNADACIVRLAQEARARGQAVTIASDDQGIRDALGGLAPAQFTGAAQLGQHLTAPPKLLAQRYRHRMAVKRMLDGDDD